MDLQAGTSGFSYGEWKGPFYPAELPSTQFLGFYAARLSTVEINNTFYRMPKAEVLARWVEQVEAASAPGFRFVLKAPQRITHKERLVDSSDSLAYLWKNAGALAPAHLGPFLFQLPPFLKVDLDRLRKFLAQLPAGMRAAFEFRHPSWFDQPVLDALGEAGCALCTADMDPKEGAEEEEPVVAATADFGYLRLRRVGYGDAELDAWIGRIRTQPWREVFVFFKHEDEGAAPRMALRLIERWAAGTAAGAPADSLAPEADAWR